MVSKCWICLQDFKNDPPYVCSIVLIIVWYLGELSRYKQRGICYRRINKRAVFFIYEKAPKAINNSFTVSKPLKSGLV